MTTHGEKRISLDRRTVARLWRVFRNFCTSEVGGWAIGMVVALVLLLMAINGLNVLNSYVGRDFMTAIQQRDWDEFTFQALRYVGVFGLSTVAAVIYAFTEQRLGLLWRGWLTRQLVHLYLGGGLYYRLHARGTVANPDQRIADDVHSLTAGTLSLALIFLNGAFTIVAFSGVLWSISHLLFVVCVGYAALGSALAVWFGRPLVWLNYDQSDREASFRAELVHVRENAESVALFRRERHLELRLDRRIDALVANTRRIIAVNRNLGFFTTGYNFMIQVIPVVIVAPLFIRGSAEFGEIPQASTAFAHLIGAFSLIVNQFGQLSSYAAVVARLSDLAEGLEAAAAMDGSGIAVSEAASGHLAVEGLTLRTPQDGRVLIHALSLDLGPGVRALVAGPHDATLALERAIASLWASGEGRIARPRDVMLLPERPYLPPGTLRELLGIADGMPRADDDELWRALRTAGVEPAVQRVGGLDREGDWDDLLSLQEQRLVEVARMLLAAPRFVLLTRLDASLGAATAAEILGMLRSRGIGCVVLEDDVAHAAQFDEVVQIAADGTWVRIGAKAATG
ncbi:MAG TPA: ABC transporter transmembrane domain-containing protein [Candidatus Binatia bacterium]|nr:ABC transporter transmembrane domain-containing protein [Candidatus Binatia bacterium]